MQKKRLRVNIVSESVVSVQGHGVHTAYEEMCRVLESRDDVEVMRNKFSQKLDCDIVHFHTVGSRTWKKLFQKGPKKVISAHVVPDSFVGSLVGANLWKPFATLYLRWFYNKADLILAVSEQTKCDLEAIRVTRPIKVVHNFIDTSIYQSSDPTHTRSLRHELGIESTALVVIGAGQVQPRKRVDVFLAAARALPDVTFVWVGGMPFGRLAAEYEEMRQLMETGLPNLIFPGIVPLETMPQYYHMADIFMLPSTQETFGLVVVEAAASGLPVVLRDLPEYQTTFKDNAWYCQDDHAFIDAVRQLADENKRRDWQNHARVLAERFDSKRAGSYLSELYHGLV